MVFHTHRNHYLAEPRNLEGTKTRYKITDLLYGSVLVEIGMGRDQNWTKCLCYPERDQHILCTAPGCSRVHRLQPKHTNTNLWSPSGLAIACSKCTLCCLTAWIKCTFDTVDSGYSLNIRNLFGTFIIFLQFERFKDRGKPKSKSPFKLNHPALLSAVVTYTRSDFIFISNVCVNLCSLQKVHMHFILSI